MSSVEELRSRIAVVNSTSARLNEQRNRNLGMRETLERQRDSAIRSYKEKYGIDLTQISIDSEYARLMQEKEAEVSVLERAIASIDAGDYATARSILGIAEDGTKPVASAPVQVSQPAAPVMPSVHTEPLSGVGEPTAPVAPSTPPTLHAPASVPPEFQAQLKQPDMVGMDSILKAPEPVEPSAPVSPVAPTAPVTPSAPVIPSAPASPNVAVGSGLDLSNLSAPPVITNKATDFSGILNGEPFSPAKL